MDYVVTPTSRRAGAEFFLNPASALQRQYEVLRAYLVEGLSAADAAARFGYSPASLHALACDLRAGRLRFFPVTRTGPKKAPKRDAARSRIIELRKQNYSVYDIQKILRLEGSSVSHVLIHQLLRKEGFAKLPRRAESERPAVPRPEVQEIADIRQLDWSGFARCETEGGGLFVLLPALVEWGLDGWVERAGLPGSQMIPALQSILAMLALKLTGKERLSHVMDVCADPGFALFAGLNAMPKTTALSTYSYRVTRDMTASLLRSYNTALTQSGLLVGKSFNLDFHTIPHRGTEAVLEKHYVSSRSRRERSILTFLVQDNDARVLCYADATVHKDGAAREILEFVEFWKEQRGEVPPHLVFDSQLTTYAVMGELDALGIRFITLRRRGRDLLQKIRAVPQDTWKRMTLTGVSRKYRNPRYYEAEVSVRGVRSKLRQIVVDGLGHDEPTLILTNDHETKAVDVVERYAQRMLIENAIAENIGFFHLDSLSSAIALQVDLDVMLTLIANALFRDLARHLEGFEAARPKQVFRRFLNAPARIRVTDTEVNVQIRRCTHHPILLASHLLDRSPVVPWWGGRRLHVTVA